MSYRTDAVRAALDEWKAHPKGRPQLYWQEVLRPYDPTYHADWCGAFVLRSLKKAGLAKRVFWKIGEGFAEGLMPKVNHPQPGDMLYVPRYQHQAMVASYDPATGTVVSIDGNQPGIDIRSRVGGMTFYSIQPLIDEAERGFPWVAVAGGAAAVGAAMLAQELWRRRRNAA